MNFDPETDFLIFADLLKKRPEITPDSLKESLKNYYLPYVEKLLKLKIEAGNDSGLVIGVSAIQGAGKTTQGEILEVLLKHFDRTSVSLSIDDHYITHKELVELRQKDPRFIRRGVTHDIALAVKNIEDLVNYFSGKPVLVASYDKGAQKGDGDRFAFINPIPNLTLKAKVFEEGLVINKELQQAKALKIISARFGSQDLQLPENMGSNIPINPQFLPVELVGFLLKPENQVVNISTAGQAVFFTGASDINIPASKVPKGWRLVFEKPDFIFYDGWMLGARKVEDESVFSSGLPALEKPEDIEFAKFINNKLQEYDPLWNLINFMNVLYVANYEMSLKWRDQAEEALRAKGAGMTHDQITEFVHYFWRSVHPAIQIKNLAQNPETDQVVVINDDHSIKEVLKPEEVEAKYP
jgi:pantothenate kinase-related protein Tda10